MCGIAGIWNLDGKPVSNHSIDRFTDSLVHRGPDGRGIWRDDKAGIALGHRRLRILDLTEKGHQPMSYHGRYWITYNGEIYNFLELRQELELKGFVFRSQTDTEVIVAAYLAWGPEALSRFNGMWAFAIYDQKERCLFFARDRFGIKPFLYYFNGLQFAFASELKAFKYLDGHSPEIDGESAVVFLQDGMALEGTQRTMLQGIRRLQAGYYGIVHAGKLQLKRWWNTLEHLVDAPAEIEKQADQFHELFYNSVRLRMRSDVPIGSCLSGGFDSSAVVCALAEIGKNHTESRQSTNWHQTFVATFPRAFNDERTRAEEVVNFAGVRGHFLQITENDALRDVDRILNDFDDVYTGMPTAIWLIYRELRRANVIVSLDGHGADELMGGYKLADYLLFHGAPGLWSAPFQNIKLIRQYWKVLRDPYGLTRSRQRMKMTLAGFCRNHPTLATIYARTHRLRHWRPHPFLKGSHSPDSTEFLPQCQEDQLPEEWDGENRSLYQMFHATILPTILRNFDRLSMAHGVEVRMPFMDWRLVSFVFSLPGASKFNEGMTKFVARKAMKGHMPESIRIDPFKIGFNSPLPEWLNGPLQPWVRDLIESASFKDHPLLNSRTIKNFIETNTRRTSWSWQNCETAWKFLHFFWFEQNFLKRSESPATLPNRNLVCVG